MDNFIFEILRAIKANTFDLIVARQYSWQGFQKLRLGGYNAAIQDYTNAIKQKPNFARAYYRRGLARLKVNDNKGAMEDFSKAIELKPQRLKYYFGRGVSKYKLKNYKGAIDDYTVNLNLLKLISKKRLI